MPPHSSPSDEEDDYQSINLLESPDAQTPPAVSDTTRPTAGTTPSPATQTLHQLSQVETVDLRYDHSQLTRHQSAAPDSSAATSVGDSGSRNNHTPVTRNHPQPRRTSRKPGQANPGKPVQQFRHGLLVQTFPSLRNAALLTGLSRRFLMQQCRAGLTAVHGTTTLTANNTHTEPVHDEWRYALETNTPTVSPLPLTVTQSTSSPDRIAALHNLAERLAPDYQLVHVTVPPPDSVTLTSTTPVVSLGLSITRSELPIALRRHGIPSATDTTNRIRGCRVDALATNSWAGRCGVRVDDWFLHVAEGSTHQAITTSPLVPLVTMASYDDFVTRAKTWGRQQNSTDGTAETLPPMELYLVRRKVTAPPATVVNLTDPSVATVNDVPHRGPLVSPNDPRNRGGLALGHPATPAETATVRKIHVHSTPSKTTSTKRSEPKKPPVDSRNPTAQPIRTNRVQAKRTPDKSWILPNPVAFCHKCNGRSAKVHHAWCRKHAQFANSGADDILERITQGVRLGCAACWQEYQNGRILKDEPHNYECLERQKSIPSSSNDEAEPTQSLEKRPREGIAPKKHIRDQDFPLKRRKLTNARLEQPYQRPTDVKPWLAELQDSDVGGNDSDLSAYQDPDAPRRRPNLKVAHRGVQISNTKIGKTAKSKASLVTNGKAKHGIHKLPKESQRPLKKSQSSKGKETSITSTEPKSAETAPSIVQRENSLSRNAYIVEDDFQMARKPDSVIDDESTSAGVDWESCEDPWGPPGHAEGDVVLFAPATGLGHHETILPSKRYEAAPFSSSTRYCRTHRTPQEGFHALVLRRDPLADRPWGFECCRHEFGGACLVETVEPLSPAASAVFVGDLNKAGSGPGLLPKDLLISINGRLVGGMTEIGLDIELETSGAEMILLVSRYKFSDQLRVRIQKAERKDWDTIDISLNDDRLVDWTDIGSEEQRSGIDEVGQTEPKEDSTGELTCSRHIADTQSDDGHSRLSPRCTRTISPVPPSCPTELVVEEILKELSQHEIALETRPQMGCQGLVPTLCSPTPNMASDPGRAQVSNSDSMTGTKGSLVTAEKEAAQIMAAGFAPINGESSRVHQTSLAFLANLPGDVSSTEVSTTGGVPLKSTDRLSPDEVSAHMAIKRSLSQDVNTSQFVKHSYGISPVQLHQDSCIDTRTNTNEQSQCSKQSSNEDKWEDDENAWVGCVCTKIHSKGVPVFWIQCDDCDTWYNVSDNCVGFSQQKAKQLEVWHCWACDHSNVEEKEVVPPSSSAKHVPAVSAEHHNGTPVFRRLDSSKPTKFRLPESEESPSALPAMPVTTRRRRSESQATQSSTTPSDQVFAEGAFVSVQQHAWPGVNNEAGIGQVLKRDKDEDGDVVYDIKYVVGGIKKGILAEYVRSHVF